MEKSRYALSRFLTVSCFAVVLGACGAPDKSVTVTPRPIEATSILIKNVAVFDSRSLQTSANMNVTVKAGEIVSVALTNNDAVPPDTHVISGEGATLVPGLIDMHGHLTTTTGPSWEFSLPVPENNLLAYAYAGVTTIFDPSDTSDHAYSRRAKVTSKDLVGPRIFTTGRIITNADGHPRAMVESLAPWWIKWYVKPKVATGVENKAQAIAAVNERADAGADAIKIVIDKIPLDAPLMGTDIARTIVEQATKRGIRTVSHVGTAEDAIAAADAGVALWVHGVYKERLSDAQISKLVSYGIPMVTTSEVFDRYGRAIKGPLKPTQLEREIVSGAVLDSFYPIPDDFDVGPLASWLTLMQETISVRQDNVRRLHQAGMTILAGSDVQSGVFPGASLHRELAGLVEAGLTPAEAIRAATLDSATFLANNDEPDAGVIAVGKRADLLLVEGDPTQDIAALANIREVILHGVLLDRAKIR